jgi:hypothetical protein
LSFFAIVNCAVCARNFWMVTKFCDHLRSGAGQLVLAIGEPTAPG